MKSKSILFISLIVSVFISCQPTTEEAKKYNDGIIEQQNLINKKFSELINSYDAYIPEEMDIKYNEVLKQINIAIDYTSNIQGFEDDAYFKEGAKTLFNSYKEVLENEQKSIIDLYKLPENEYGEEQVKEVERLRDQGNKKIDEIFGEMELVQKKFAEKYHFKI
ncbi:MAG: hypothetical protein B6I20_11130 [Bacteroidetes bacterium 4572_117]|nr:MAG: hypothetical protein B6I20_11130 [Bacteroidetes bacterium 4572_117]